MYAVEFEAKIENGIIHIPKNIGNFNQIKTAKFVMMYDSSNVVKVNFDREDERRLDSVDMIFNKYSFDMSKFKFNRDEANER